MSGVVKILVLTLRNCADSYDTQNQTYLITKIAIFYFLVSVKFNKKIYNISYRFRQAYFMLSKWLLIN